MILELLSYTQIPFHHKFAMYLSNIVKVFGWCKKVTYHLIQCSVVNAHILLKQKFKLEINDKNFTLLVFMKNLIDDIFTTCTDNSDVTVIDLEEVELLDKVDGPRCNYIRTSTI